MPARSKAAAIAAAAFALVACTPKPEAGPVVTAPRPVPYTCEQQRQAAAELATLPAGSVLGVMVGDYLNMRRQARTALGEAEPKACP